MSKVPVTFAAGFDYDRLRPLLTGEVRVEGVDWRHLILPLEEVFWRMVKYQEFDASEMSMSSYIIARSRGDCPFIAIPVFPSRIFRHSCIYVNKHAGIERPADLKGKRVGIPEYQMTAAVWERGLLQHEYGVSPSDVEWYQGGEEQPGREEKIPLRLPEGIRIHPIPADTTLSEMLDRGEIDALLSARMPSTFRRGRGNVRRLFEDFKQVEQEYYRRTGIFPIMHTVVLREELVRQHPWLAYNVYSAFCRAKSLCLERMYESGALPYTLPWLLAHVEEQEAVLGPDPWPYGVEANRKAIETLCQYSYEQGLSERLMTVEELFVPTTFTGARV